MIDSEATALTELVRALVIIGAAFGFAVTDAQQAALIAGIAAAAIIVSGALALWNRYKVYSKATTQRIANAATFQAPGTVVDIGNPPAGPAG